MCLKPSNLEDLHGINEKVLYALLREFYPGLGLAAAAEKEETTNCWVVRHMSRKGLHNPALIPPSRVEGVKARLVLNRDELRLKAPEYRRERIQRMTEEQNRSRQRKLETQEARRLKLLKDWEDFFAILDKRARSEFGVSRRELFMLVRHQPMIFRRYFESEADFIYNSLGKNMNNFGALIDRAIRAREAEVLAQGQDLVAAVLIRVKYLLYEVSSEMDAHKALGAACKGNSHLFAATDPTSGDIPASRMNFLKSLVDDSKKFQEYFLALWDSPRATEYWLASSKKAGDPWDPNIKY